MKKFLVSTAIAAAMCSAPALAQEEDGAILFLNSLNDQLEAQGASVRVYSAEMVGSGEGLEMGRTVIASNHGNKQLGHDWALNDEFRGSRTNITYMVDSVDYTGDISAAEQDDVVDAALQIWDEEQCSNIGIDKLPAAAPDLGYVQFLVGFGGSPVTVGPLLGEVDIVHGGFLGPNFFDVIAGCAPGAGCGANILGVTFTFTWTGTDWDNNGKADAAIREMYYNDNFTWVNDGVLGERGDGVFDFATVAIHESGHALSRAHFGNVAIHHKKGLTTSPAAVMNAIYGGVKRSLLGPDSGGHCSDWSAWPTQN